MEPKFYPLAKSSAELILNTACLKINSTGLARKILPIFFIWDAGLANLFRLAFLTVTLLSFTGSANADFTVAAGTTVNASSLTSQVGILTINGKLNVDQPIVSLLNFTQVIIEGANGQIFWVGNNDLKFAAGVSIAISNVSLGLQPTAGNGNASTRLYIGATVIAVSSDHSNNAAFSFETFNYVGGLPEFILTTSPTSICYGSSFTATLSPQTAVVNYDCSWSATPSSGVSLTPASGSNFSNFNTAQTVSFLYPNTPQSYTLSCKIKMAGAGVYFATKTTSVSVNPIPALPTLVTTSPSSICVGSNSALNAVAAAGTIEWYTTNTGGTSIGSSASAANYSASPVSNTTFYAQAKNNTTGCVSASRIAVSVAVIEKPVGGNINGSSLVCSGTNSTQMSLSGYSGTIQWQRSTDNSTFINMPGAVSANLTATNLTATTYYRAEVSNSICPFMNSSTGLVAISPGSVAGIVSGAGNVCSGSNTSNLVLTGNTGTIQWQSSIDNNSFNDIPGAITTSYAASNLTATTYYRAISVSGVCLPELSEPATVNVIPLPIGGTISGSTAVCLGNNTTGLTLTENIGEIIKWQSSALADFSEITTDITNTSGSITVENLTSNLYYRTVVSNGCGIAHPSPAFVTIHNLWTGTISNDWNTTANWADGALPSVNCADVTIASGTKFSPVLLSGVATINNLVIQPGAALVVIGGRLQIAGTINNDGTFNAENGSIEFTGDITQTISGSIFTGNTIKNLTISNNIAVDNTPGNLLNITGTIAFGDVDNVTLNTGDNIVLVSTASNTARVADITNNGLNSGNQITGKAIVQRFLPARRAWRLFTSPVAKGGNVYDNWQNGGLFEPGKGTYVTGTGATNPTGSNGLDWSFYNNASLKTGVNLTPVLNTKLAGISKNVADTSDNIAYFIFVRGDRRPENTNPANSNQTTLTSKGKLQTGRQTFIASPVAAAYTLVGNPYASSVELSKIVRNNVLNRFYLWDPTLNAEQGGYVVFDDINNTGTYSYTASRLTPVLQSGQGFFIVSAANGPASIVFDETAKSSANNLLAFRSAKQPMSLRINLYGPNEINTPVLLDGTLAQFDNSFKKLTDWQDAPKATNIKEMLALQRDTQAWAIERRPVPAGDDTLFLQLTNTKLSSYRLDFEPLAVDSSLSAWLDDSFTGKTIPLNLNGNSSYSFEITLDENSAHPDRFRVRFGQLLFGKKTTTRYLTAELNNGHIALEWAVENEKNMVWYGVEKSEDGINFRELTTIRPKETDASSSKNSYTWQDKTPAPGSNYYRISTTEPTGKVYGNMVLVNSPNLPDGVSVFPNPAAGGNIIITFKKMKAGVYHLQLLNSTGRVVVNKTVNHAASTLMEEMKPGFKLARGIYQLKITTVVNKITTVNVMIK